MKRSWEIDSVEGLDRVVEFLLPLLNQYRVIALYGDLGSGKTTLVSRIMTGMGSTDEVSSPTYALINEYDTASGVVAHIDLYRLDEKAEVMDIGLAEYLDRAICFIEWPQIIQDELDETINIHLITKGGSNRLIEVELPEGYTP